MLLNDNTQWLLPIHMKGQDQVVKINVYIILPLNLETKLSKWYMFYNPKKLQTKILWLTSEGAASSKCVTVGTTVKWLSNSKKRAKKPRRKLWIQNL